MVLKKRVLQLDEEDPDLKMAKLIGHETLDIDAAGGSQSQAEPSDIAAGVSLSVMAFRVLSRIVIALLCLIHDFVALVLGLGRYICQGVLCILTTRSNTKVRWPMCKLH
jgi:hypothetical protein